jgi:tetratricopeptide (TPR) repeat protein
VRRNDVATIVLSISLAAVGCHRHSSVAANPAVVIPPVPPRVAPAPRVLPGPEPLPRIDPPPAPVPPLEEANRAFDLGNYDEAEIGYKKYLEETPSGGQRDIALFRLALIFASRPSPADTISTLKQLTEEFPNSAISGPANLILSLHAQALRATNDARVRDQKLKQLATELERLKKIDGDRLKKFP